MIPTKIIVIAEGEFKPGLAVRLKFQMSKKNHFHYTVFLNEAGEAQVSKSELLSDFGRSISLFGMDYKDPRTAFTGHIDASVMSKEEIEKSIQAHDTFGSDNYPPAYLSSLKKALVSNINHDCVVSAEQFYLPQSEEDINAEKQFLVRKIRPKSFACQAAGGSWASSIIVFFLLVFSSFGARLILEIVALVLIFTGLGFGIVALFGIPKNGLKGILVPALVGIIFNGLLLFIFITNFLEARARN